MPNAQSEIVVGVRRVGTSGNTLDEDEPGGAAVQIMWVKIGDVYISSNNSYLVSVEAKNNYEPMMVTIKLGASGYRTVDFFGSEAPEEFQIKEKQKKKVVKKQARRPGKVSARPRRLIETEGG